MKMVSKLKIIAFTLVAIFCFDVIAETASVYFISHTASKVESLESSAAKETFQNPEVSSLEICKTPCHASECHIGHCNHYLTSKYPIAYSIQFEDLQRSQNDLLPKNPFIDSLKRPPRTT